MRLSIVHIGTRSGKSGVKSHYEALTQLYLDRIQPYHSCDAEIFPSENGFLAWLARPSGKSGRTSPAPLVVLLDSRGQAFSSPQTASWLGARRDQGVQHLVFAIGPADGWSASTVEQIRAQGGLLLSFGPITMPHELARLVLAEQVYRACTILAGHPYHGGH